MLKKLNALAKPTYHDYKQTKILIERGSCCFGLILPANSITEYSFLDDQERAADLSWLPDGNMHRIGGMFVHVLLIPLLSQSLVGYDT